MAVGDVALFGIEADADNVDGFAGSQVFFIILLRLDLRYRLLGGTHLKFQHVNVVVCDDDSIDSAQVCLYLRANINPDESESTCNRF